MNNASVFWWVVSAFALFGVVLNAMRVRWCFIIWLFTNAAWAIYDFRLGAYPQTALFSAYFVLAIWGWFRWKQK